MKKSILSFIVIVCMMTACIQHNETVPSCNCPPNASGLTTRYIKSVPLDWVQTNPGEEFQYVYASYNLPEITKNVINNGAVLSYLLENDGTDNLLPFVFPLNDSIVENIRYSISEGQITFIREDSKNGYNYPKDSTEFKVSIFSPN